MNEDVRQTTKHVSILLKRAQKRNAWKTDGSLTDFLFNDFFLNVFIRRNMK
jgi:hypothetical protein